MTVPEERGRVAGFIGFVSLLLYLILYITLLENSDFQRTLVLGIILNLGSLATMPLKQEKVQLTTKKDERVNHFEKRVVLFYLVPCVLFCLINATLAKNISFHISQQVSPSLYMFLAVLQIIGTIFGALTGGTVADFFGRKLSLAFSLTLYGICSALAGIPNNSSLLYFVYFANGLSWGILLIIYTFVIWGDLANKENCAKMYALGFTIFYLTQGIGLLPLELILQRPLIVSSLGSCLLIFLSNIPVFLAPELLSSDFHEKIKLKMYMNTVKKIRQF